MGHQYTMTILEHHLDSFGHVNNATYLEIFEEARWDLITNNGYGLAEVQKTQQGPVILEVQVKFLRELKNRQKITVVTDLIDYPGKVGRVKQQIIFPDGQIAAEAIFTLGLFDLQQRKMISATPEWRKAIGLN